MTSATEMRPLATLCQCNDLGKEDGEFYLHNARSRRKTRFQAMYAPRRAQPLSHLIRTSRAHDTQSVLNACRRPRISAQTVAAKGRCMPAAFSDAIGGVATATRT